MQTIKYINKNQRLKTVSLSKQLSSSILMMKNVDVLEENDPDIKDKLLQIIEDGDATAILSSEYTQSLNELIKLEFISIENEKLQLTEKGLQAKLIGVKGAMEKNPLLTEEIKLSDFTQPTATKGISNQAFLIILFFFLISLLAIAALMMI